MCHAVLCEDWEEPFDRPLPDIVVDLCSPLFLKVCLARNSQGVFDAADSQTLLEEGKFRLRVLAQLDALVDCPNVVCFA